VKRAASFYFLPEWRKLRWAVLRRDAFRCVVCGRDVSGSGPARVDISGLVVFIRNLRSSLAIAARPVPRTITKRIARRAAERPTISTAAASSAAATAASTDAGRGKIP
jgi:hypothetical protein